jgi:Fe-S cluster assembly protein SufB
MINQSNKVLNNNITKLVNQTYQYGFSTNIEKDIIEKGLNEKTIKLISKKKKRNRVFIRISIKSVQKMETNAGA